MFKPHPIITIMLRIIKLLLYYLAYQLVFTFAARVIDAIPDLMQGVDISSNYPSGTMPIALALFLSTLMMSWHLLHFGYAKFNRESFTEISGRTILYCILLLVAAQIISTVINEMLGFADNNQEMFFAMSRNVFGFLSMAVLAPVMEELLFRGAIQGHLQRIGWHPAWAIFTSAFIFGAVHGNPAQIPFAFLMGVVFGWLYYRTGSLLPGIVGHVLNNTFAACMILASTREEMDDTMVEMLGAPLTYVLFSVAIVTFIGMGIFLNKHLPKPVATDEIINE